MADPRESLIVDVPRVEQVRHLAASLGLPFVDLEAGFMSCGTLRKLDAAFSARERCVPLVWNARRIVLAVDDPARGVRLAACSAAFGAPHGREVEIALATPRGIDLSLEKRLTIVRG